MEKGKKKNLWALIQESINAKSIVFVAMLVVGGFCFILSAMNTTNYLQMTGIHSGKALLTGLALVIFSSTCLTSAQLFLQKSGVVKLFSIPFIVIGIVVIIFSMFSTLSLNYAKFCQSESVQKEIEAKTAIEKSKIQSEKSNVKDWSMGKVDELLELSKETGESWATTLGQIATISKSLSETESLQNEQISVEILPASFLNLCLHFHKLRKNTHSTFSCWRFLRFSTI